MSELSSHPFGRNRTRRYVTDLQSQHTGGLQYFSQIKLYYLGCYISYIKSEPWAWPWASSFTTPKVALFFGDKQIYKVCSERVTQTQCLTTFWFKPLLTTSLRVFLALLYCHTLLNEQRLVIMLVVISDVEVAVSRMVCMEAHTCASEIFFPEIIKCCLSDEKLNFSTWNWDYTWMESPNL